MTRQWRNTRLAAELLGRSDLFRGLSAPDLDTVAYLARPVASEANGALFAKDDPADTLFVIETGRVALTLALPTGDSTRTVTIVEKGMAETIAWSSLVSPFRYTHGAHCLTTTSLLALDAGMLRALFVARPRLHASVASALAELVASRLGAWQALAIQGVRSWARTPGEEHR